MSQKKKKSKNTTVKEAVPFLKELSGVDDVMKYIEGDTRDGVNDAAEKRISELEEEAANAETVTIIEVDYQLVKDLKKVVTEKVNADKKQRGMSQPNAIDKALISAKKSLELLFK